MFWSQKTCWCRLSMLTNGVDFVKRWVRYIVIEYTVAFVQEFCFVIKCELLTIVAASDVGRCFQFANCGFHINRWGVRFMWPQISGIHRRLLDKYSAVDEYNSLPFECQRLRHRFMRRSHYHIFVKAFVRLRFFGYLVVSSGHVTLCLLSTHLSHHTILLIVSKLKMFNDLFLLWYSFSSCIT